MRTFLFCYFFLLAYGLSSLVSAQTTFPSDYAREPTLQSISEALTDPGTPVETPTAKTDAEIQSQFFSGTFDSLISWQVPSVSAQCPTGSVSIFGVTYVLDAHCTMISNSWTVISTAMMAFWTITALFIVLSA